MSEELRAAAERVRAAEAWSSKDERELVNAYLAEHPADDDEPITQEWLAQADVVLPVSLSNPRFTLWLWGASGIHTLSCECCECDREMDYDLPHIKTRGDVRRLCRALGIELKETP